MASSTADAAFYRTLASLHRAGVGWPEAVRGAGGRGNLWAGIAGRLEAGDALADALGPFVDPLDHALIKAGETSGALEATFERLAVSHEEQDRDRQERRTALAYPVLVALVGSVLMAVPDLVQGRVLQGLLWSALILVPTFVFVRLTTTRWRGGLGRARLPYLGPWKNVVDEADARALAALAACEDAGVAVTESVALAARAGAGGRVAEDLLDRAAARVAAGDDLAGAWEAVPDAIASRLASAEHVGSFGQAAQQVAEGLRFEVRQRRARSLARLPVFLILILGAIVAARMFSFYGDWYGNLPGR